MSTTTDSNEAVTRAGEVHPTEATPAPPERPLLDAEFQPIALPKRHVSVGRHRLDPSVKGQKTVAELGGRVAS